MKKKKIIVIGVILISVFCLFVATIYVRQTSDQKTESTDNHFGIPEEMFLEKKDVKIDYKLIHKETNQTFDLSRPIKFKTLMEQNEWIGTAKETDQIVKPNETKLVVIPDDDTFSSFAIAVTNTTKKDINFKDGTVCYVEYDGDPLWTMGGIDSTMTRDDVINKIGKPSTEATTDYGIALDYYQMIDGHSYQFSVLIDTETNKVWRVVINIDNHGVFSGDYSVTEEDISAYLESTQETIGDD